MKRIGQFFLSLEPKIPGMRCLIGSFVLWLISLGVGCQSKPDRPFHFREEWVPEYELPPLLETPAGTPITTRDAWEAHRATLLETYRQEIYGAAPEGALDSVRIIRADTALGLWGGLADRFQYRMQWWRQGRSQAADLLLYLPARASEPVPTFLGLNFSGNQTVQPDTGIWLTRSWVRNDSSLGISEHVATEASRGGLAHRWPAPRMVSRGYGLATVYCSDIAPDYARAFDQGVYPLFYRSGQTHPDSAEWGAISAWAWGLSRTLDWLGELARVDHRRVAVMGHSRLGKTALWAAAQDQRFAMAISNNSGCAGAALFRRGFGENIWAINDIAPHWFNDYFPQYSQREASLPVDQHQLLALLAPRPLYVASGEGDMWSDPKGEYLGAYYASQAYSLYGMTGLTEPEPPAVNQPQKQTIVGYHMRSGKHGVKAYDWTQYLDFADRWLK